MFVKGHLKRSLSMLIYSPTRVNKQVIRVTIPFWGGDLTPAYAYYILYFNNKRQAISHDTKVPINSINIGIASTSCSWHLGL